MYDKVLVDVTCSGTGVMAKRADSRWNKSPSLFYKTLKLQVNL